MTHLEYLEYRKNIYRGTEVDLFFNKIPSEIKNKI